MSEASVSVDGRYWAFISYSHRDAAFGRRLHRRLEGYALPRRLVGQTSVQGTVPRRLAPIFRDRDEFPAAKDLSAEVQAALKNSRSLIVVCSPTAAVSPWVAREIELFHALHPDRPILAAIREGDPHECFPEALRRAGPGGASVEPLAADFRRGHDGWELGVLKLVAGLLGIGLDELIQRDAQRTTRRVTAITAGALALVLVMGVLTAFAVSARSEAEWQRTEAERQRTEAEGLVEFMLTDLRKTLKKVGRLDAMTAVNQQALDYYGAQDLGTLPPISLERRARTLHLMGEDDEERGDLGLALAKFKEASRTTSALLALEPANPDRIFAQAQSEYWVAFIDWRRGRVDAAEAGFVRYAKFAGELLAIDPSNSAWQMEAGWAELNLGTLALRDKNRPVDAEQRFRRSLSHFNQALKAKGNDADIEREIANAYAWLGDAQRAQGHADKSLESRTAEGRILTSLHKADLDNAVYARDLVGNALGLARAERVLGKTEAALKRLKAAYADAKRLELLDKSDMKFVMQRIAVGLFLADTILLSSRGSRSDPAAELDELLGNCDLGIAKDELELADFCAVVKAKRALISKSFDAPALQYVRRNRNRLRAISFSRRWGIAFSAELAFIETLDRKE